MKPLSGILVVVVLAGTCHAQVLHDTFEIDGPLAGSSPLVGGTWMSSGGSGTLMKTGGVIVLDPAHTQKVESQFTSFSAGTQFVGLDIEVTSAPSTPWMMPVNFRGINASGGDQVGRVFVSQGSTQNTCVVGIENDKDNPVWWPSELVVGIGYRLVLGFTENGLLDCTRLWVNPSSTNDPSIAEVPEDVTGSVFGLRVNGFNNSDGALEMDNLIVTEDFEVAADFTPEPFPVPFVEIFHAAASNIAPTQIVVLVRDTLEGYYYRLFKNKELLLPQELWEDSGGQDGHGGIISWSIDHPTHPMNRFYRVEASPITNALLSIP